MCILQDGSQLFEFCGSRTRKQQTTDQVDVAVDLSVEHTIVTRHFKKAISVSKEVASKCLLGPGRIVVSLLDTLPQSYRTDAGSSKLCGLIAPQVLSLFVIFWGSILCQNQGSVMYYKPIPQKLHTTKMPIWHEQDR